MAHFILEYSANLDTDIDVSHILHALRDTALASGVFPLGGLRLRAVRYSDYVIADGKAEYAFVHLTSIIGAGRTLEVKKAASRQLFDTLTACLADVYEAKPLAISYYVCEADPALSYKQNNIHARIKTARHAAD